MSNQTWQIDGSHSGIHFAVRHLVISKVRGQFSRWTGAITVPDGDFTRATVDVTIDAASIETGVADRDTHLKSADFLDVATYPEIRFEGLRVETLDDESQRLAGKLTIHGVTRDVVLDLESAGQTQDPWGNLRAGFSAKTAIERKQFGLTWNQLLEAGGAMVGDKVEIEIEVEAVRQVETQVA